MSSLDVISIVSAVVGPLVYVGLFLSRHRRRSGTRTYNVALRAGGEGKVEGTDVETVGGTVHILRDDVSIAVFPVENVLHIRVK